MILDRLTRTFACSTPACQATVPVTGADYPDCARQARVLGWCLSADRTAATCPACVAQRHRRMAQELEDAGQDW